MIWKRATLLLLISCILLQLASTTPRRTKDKSAESASSSSSSSSDSSASSDSSEHVKKQKRSSNDESSSSNSSESSEESNSSQKLLSEFLKGFKNLVKSVTESQKSLAKKFLKNKLIANVKSDSINEIKESFSKFLAEDTSIPNKASTADAHSISQYFKTTLTAFSEYVTPLKKYKPGTLEEPTADEVLIQKALEESDAPKFFEETPKQFADFSKSFEEKVRDYVNHLSVVEEKNETKLIEWYNEFKSAEITHKVEVLGKFFDLF